MLLLFPSQSVISGFTMVNLQNEEYPNELETKNL